MGQPKYFSYFNQGESQYLNWSLLDDVDMTWVDDLNKQRALEDDHDIASKDLGNIDFPSSHEWSPHFESKFNEIVSAARETIDGMIKTADEVVTIETMKIYLDCKDGNHYFSTPFFDHGSIRVVAIDSESDFDSVDTAVYAFINDYNEWREEHGQKHDAMTQLSNLEALRQPVSLDTESGCDHEDLGSLGHRHGDIVECPYCKKMAEVW